MSARRPSAVQRCRGSKERQQGSNLEKALTRHRGSAGHLVSRGHVDAVGNGLSMDRRGRPLRWHFRTRRQRPGAPYIRREGFDYRRGISMTVNSALMALCFDLNYLCPTSTKPSWGTTASRKPA